MTILLDELSPPLSEEEAIVAADRCLECGGRHAIAPCVVACPADVDVPAFVAAVARGDAAEAGRNVYAENLLGGAWPRTSRRSSGVSPPTGTSSCAARTRTSCPSRRPRSGPPSGSTRSARGTS